MQLPQQLYETRTLDSSGLKTLLETQTFDKELTALADAVRREYYGTAVYLRGLIEFTNYCKNNCLYCGIRNENRNLERYRLTEEEILSCCKNGYELGYRTFVLQGGEDPFYTEDAVTGIVKKIRSGYPDCAVTLSLGEHPAETYQRWFNAGANRYLLRHETANNEHYRKMHPATMSLLNRKECLFHLKKIGYQVGSGFMVGTPFQTTECLIDDLRFLQELQPDMIGIGPFISHRDTPFKDFPNGKLRLTLRLISILRLMFPYALIPATTALGTIDPQGREWGLRSGANVVMPNLSPVAVRKKYELYDNKICTGEEAAECRACLGRRIARAGYEVVSDIGNVKKHS
ncbi:MAG: [FeFe] hydrogenase H-cluster radical SAM maturase HydE [Planctomycetaceae bacterium]|jgi:biotin synthase|nr:[FeFe] hydrogenase H-cluster radical SAM maturase HydE [Planctomycetaceae bacterium]